MESGAGRVAVSGRIVRTRSAWAVYEWEMSVGGAPWRGAAIGMPGALLVWAGPGADRGLGQVALAIGGAAAGGERAAPLARRLSAALRRPVWLLRPGGPLDRLAAPQLERALLEALRRAPHLLMDPVPVPACDG